MSRRGENIYKRRDNRWEGRYIKEHDTGGKTRFGYVYAKTYREVKEKLKACKSDKSQKSDQSKKKFGEFCDEWLLSSVNRVKESTYVKYYNIVENHIKPALGDNLPQNLTTILIEEFGNALIQQGLSPKTARDILTVLRAIIKYCRKRIGYPMPDTDIVYPKEEKKQMRVLSIEEQKRFVSFLMLDADKIKFGIILALLTGMRIGELCALKWKDISINEKTIHVCNTMQRIKNLDKKSDTKTKIVIGSAKSATSDRIIPMTDQAVSICKKMRSKNGEAFVLTGDMKNFVEPRALQYKLQKYTKA
ncbi:MAG: tyrosine-type recombinase/integrase, partial [Eubacteriales bacterium]